MGRGLRTVRTRWLSLSRGKGYQLHVRKRLRLWHVSRLCCSYLIDFDICFLQETIYRPTGKGHGKDRWPRKCDVRRCWCYTPRNTSNFAFNDCSVERGSRWKSYWASWRVAPGERHKKYVRQPLSQIYRWRCGYVCGIDQQAVVGPCGYRHQEGNVSKLEAKTSCMNLQVFYKILVHQIISLDSMEELLTICTGRISIPIKTVFFHRFLNDLRHLYN